MRHCIKDNIYHKLRMQGYGDKISVVDDQYMLASPYDVWEPMISMVVMHRSEVGGQCEEVS